MPKYFLIMQNFWQTLIRRDLKTLDKTYAGHRGQTTLFPHCRRGP